MEFFFHGEVLSRVRGLMDDRVAADQWGCEVALRAALRDSNVATVSMAVTFDMVRNMSGMGSTAMSNAMPSTGRPSAT
jgi:hypothetical protein